MENFRLPLIPLLFTLCFFSCSDPDPDTLPKEDWIEVETFGFNEETRVISGVAINKSNKDLEWVELTFSCSGTVNDHDGVHMGTLKARIEYVDSGQRFLYETTDSARIGATGIEHVRTAWNVE